MHYFADTVVLLEYTHTHTHTHALTIVSSISHKMTNQTGLGVRMPPLINCASTEKKT